MEALYKVLPPFAPDYSGVCSALFELGGILVVHDGGGCTGNCTGYDEPRWYGSTSAVFSSGLREIDAVVGDDAKLLLKLENSTKNLERRFIAIIGSPAPMVIGTDYAALARLLSEKLKMPVLTFDTKGLDYYDAGASLAFLVLARQFVKPASDKIEGGVNIIGATPLDIGSRTLPARLSNMLTAAGCRIVSSWSMGATLDDIAQAGRARLNIVISRSGLEAARYMEQEHGIPYIADVPIGCAPSIRFIDAVCSSLKLNGVAILGLKSHKPESHGNVRKVLVIGEQLMSNAMRNCLRMDMNVPDITVASFFGMESTLLEDGDVRLSCEDALTDLTRNHPYDVIVGDPLYRDLIASQTHCRFIDFPHIAVSSRIYWDKEFDYFGEDGLRFFENHFKEIGG
jgi:nitrogenase molybdenum-cofactor synthesis protein NifE